MSAGAGGIRAARAFVGVGWDDKEMQKGIQSSNARLKSFGNAAKAAGAELFALGTAAAIPFILAAKEFAGFEQEMATVKAVTGATTEQFALLNEQAKLLGLTTTFTAREAAAGMVSLGRAGLSTAEILDAIPNVLDLARATATELGTAAEITASSMRIFGLEAADTQRIVDVLTETTNQSAQTLEGVAEALKFVGPFANQAGQSIEETAAALGILANNGIRGTIAGTSLARAFKNLSQQAKVLKLRDIGVDAKDAAGNFRKITVILKELDEITSDLGSQEKLSIFEDLFGRGAAGAIVLAESNDQFKVLLKTLEDSRGAAERTADIMDNTLAGSFRLLISAVQGAGIAVGESLSPALRQIIGIVRNAFVAFESFVTNNKTLIVVLGASAVAVAAFGASLLAIGAAASLFGTIRGIIVGVTGAMAGFTLQSTAAATATNFLGASTFTLSRAYGTLAASQGAAIVGQTNLITSVAATTPIINALIKAMGPLLVIYAAILAFEAFEIFQGTEEVIKNIKMLNKEFDKTQKKILELDKAGGTGLSTTTESAAENMKEFARQMEKAGKSAEEITDELKKRQAFEEEQAAGFRGQEGRGTVDEQNVVLGKAREAEFNARALSEIIVSIGVDGVDAFEAIDNSIEAIEKRQARTLSRRTKNVQALEAIESKSSQAAADAAKAKEREAALRVDPQAVLDIERERHRVALDNLEAEGLIARKIIEESGGLKESEKNAVKAAEAELKAKVKVVEETAKVVVQAEKAVASKRIEAIKLVGQAESDIREDELNRIATQRQRDFNKAVKENPAQALADAIKNVTIERKTLDDLRQAALDQATAAEASKRKADIDKAAATRAEAETSEADLKKLETFKDRAAAALKKASEEVEKGITSQFGTFAAARIEGLSSRAGEKIQVKQLEVQEKMVEEQKKTNKNITKLKSGALV